MIDARQVIAVRAVDPHKLPASFFARVNLEKLAEMPAGNDEIEFLLDFPHGASAVVFATVEVARSAGVVVTGKGVFGGTSLLDEKPAQRIEDQYMDCPVAQSPCVDLPARGLANDAINGVNYIEEFVRALCQM